MDIKAENLLYNTIINEIPHKNKTHRIHNSQRLVKWNATELGNHAFKLNLFITAISLGDKKNRMTVKTLKEVNI